MVDQDELAQTIASLQEALEAMGVAWAVGGSLASASWGEPRSTNDVDVIVGMGPQQARWLAERLEPTFYADPDVAADAAEHSASFNVIDQRSMLKVDIFVPPAGPMGVGQLDRRCSLPLFSGRPPVPVLGPEDTILQKLRWFDLGGRVSDRQWHDIVAVLRLCDEPLDDAYMDVTATGADLGELLARARADARPEAEVD